MDKLTYASNLENLCKANDYDNYQFIKGDIGNRELVEHIFATYDISDVIHLAAESHVDNSIENASVFVQTNVLGTQTLLDVAYKCWMDNPFEH